MGKKMLDFENKTNNDLQHSTSKTTDGTRLIPEENQVFRKGNQFLLHLLRPSCYKPGDKS